MARTFFKDESAGLNVAENFSVFANGDFSLAEDVSPYCPPDECLLDFDGEGKGDVGAFVDFKCVCLEAALKDLRCTDEAGARAGDVAGNFPEHGEVFALDDEMREVGIRFDGDVSPCLHACFEGPVMKGDVIHADIGRAVEAFPRNGRERNQ